MNKYLSWMDKPPAPLLRESAGWRLVDAHQIAGRVAHGTVPRAPRLLGRLLHDIGTRGAHLLEDEVEVLGAEVDAVEGSLGEQSSDYVTVLGAAALVVGEDDRDVGLRGGADGDPPEPVVADVVAQFKAEYVAVKGQCEVRVMDEDEAAGNRDIHACHARPALLERLRSCAACGSGGSCPWRRSRAHPREHCDHGPGRRS